MKCFCPECYDKLKNVGDKKYFLCILRPVNVEGLEEVGQCPRCKKIWTQEGYEVKITYTVKGEKNFEFNPSKRT